MSDPHLRWHPSTPFACLPSAHPPTQPIHPPTHLMKGEACSRRLMSPYMAEAMVASGVLPEQVSRSHSSASLLGGGWGIGQGGVWQVGVGEARGHVRCICPASIRPPSATKNDQPADLASGHEAVRSAQHLHRSRFEDAAAAAALVVGGGGGSCSRCRRGRVGVLHGVSITVGQFRSGSMQEDCCRV